MNLLRSFHKRLLLAAIFIIGFSSCKKAAEDPASEKQPTNLTIKDVREIFEHNNYSLTLFEPIIRQQNLKTRWQPQWWDARTATGGKNLKYYYVPTKQGSKDQIDITNARVYLLAASDSSKTALYKAVYIADKPDIKKQAQQTSTLEASFFRTFTGVLVMTDLATKRERIIPYAAGQPIHESGTSQWLNRPQQTPLLLLCAATGQSAIGQLVAQPPPAPLSQEYLAPLPTHGLMGPVHTVAANIQQPLSALLAPPYLGH